MITEQDLEQAIAECQGERNPNANTCIKLAAYYTIRNEMFGKSEQFDHSGDANGMVYSYGAEPTAIDYDSGTDFSQAIHGRNPEEIWPIMDELMSTLKVLHQRLYDAVMRRL